ncbi:hypothetical protein [Nostoc sp.]|uniref:hypothetical protein n=1 Tax=Nostoc sp. TaxID=1180 RepID=UPI002FFA484C
MSNYLYQLIAKNFNLINTIQPLVLSAFEPLPESIPNWEPSTLTTEETELPKSTPNLPEEPNFKLSLDGFFPESVLSQSTPGNLLLTPNTDEEINPTPPITAPTRLLQKQLTEIDSVVYFGQSPEVGSGEQLPTQLISESEMISPATNQVASPPSSEPFKPAPVSQTKPSLSSRVVSVLATESNTFLSNPIDQQSQPKTKSFPQQPIEINRLSLSLQSPFKPDLQIYFDENQTETVVFPFASQENTFSQPSLNTTIFRTAIANKNNAPMSRLTVEKLGELTTQSLNNQSIGINQAVYLHTSLQILHLKQSPTQVQAENSTILPILNVLQPDNSSYLENLSLNLSPQRKETWNFLPDSVATGVRDLGFSGNFSYHVKSQAVDWVLPIGDQKPLTSVLRMETSTSTLNPVIQPQEKLVSELLQKQPLQITENISSAQVQKPITSEVLPRQIIEEPTGMSKTGFSTRGYANTYTSAVTRLSHLTPNLTVETSTPALSSVILQQEKSVTELPQKRSLQITENISSAQVQKPIISEVLPRQIIEEPTGMSTTGNSWRGYANTYTPAVTQLSPLTPALAVETSTPALSSVILQQEKSVTELPQKRSLQITENISSAQVQKPITSKVLPRQIIEEPTGMSKTGFSTRGYANTYTPAVTQLSHLTPALAVETSTPALSSVILQQEKSVTELLQKRSLQITENISSAQVQKPIISEVLPRQIIEEATAISTTGNSWRGYANAYAPAIAQLSPLTPALAVEANTSASTTIQPQEQPVTELPQKRSLQITENISSAQVQKPIASEVLPRQIIEEPTAMSTTGNFTRRYANAYAPAIAQLSPLTPTIATETNVTSPPPSVEPQEKLTSDVPKIQQRFVQKNVSSMQPFITDASAQLSSFHTNISTAPLVDNLASSIISQPTKLTTINSDIVLTPALHPSSARTDTQSQKFSNSHLSDLRGNETSAQEVGSQKYNTNYRKHIATQKIGVAEQWDELGQAGGEMNVSHVHHPANMERQKIHSNEGILTSPIENLILPQKASPNLSMSADRGKDGVGSSYFRQLEESDLRPLSQPINDLTMTNLSVIAASSKKDQRRSSAEYKTPPAIQVTIGRLEIRSATPAPPPPRPKPRPAPSVMSLNEYLRRRAGGK